MKGRVAVYTDPRGPLEIREYPVPDPLPGGVLVRMRQANLCGSDLHFWRGHGPFAPGTPIVLGHEGVGTVAALGAGVTTDNLGRALRVGDRIVYSYFKPCGKCWACVSGKAACPTRNRDWIGRRADESPYFNGTYGDYHYLFPGHWIYRVPDELPDELASPVNCALCEVIYALHRGRITLGDTVVVQGAGGLGLYAAAVARELGAAHVVAFDRLPARLDLARQFGADVTVNVDETTPEEREVIVRDHSDGIGADLVIELVGSPAVVPEGIRLLRPGGTYVWVGNIGVGRCVEIEPAQVVRLHKSILGIIAYEQWAIPRALDFLLRTRAKYPFRKIISHQFPFERVNEALAVADAGECIRAALVF
ncbi:MAG: zinc-binding dehydrogenase [Armatimonadetes bacterium]|nr:zinc-binding dehydrogenase [Armatimonadota bacterium]